MCDRPIVLLSAGMRLSAQRNTQRTALRLLEQLPLTPLWWLRWAAHAAVFFLVDLGGGVYAQKCYDPDCRHFRSAWLPLPAAVASQLHISTRKPARSAGHPATCECTECQLVAFDRNPKYGPKSGITRHLRARRALDLSLGLSDGLAQLILGQKDAAYDIK